MDLDFRNADHGIIVESGKYRSKDTCRNRTDTASPYRGREGRVHPKNHEEMPNESMIAVTVFSSV